MTHRPCPFVCFNIVLLFFISIRIVLLPSPGVFAPVSYTHLVLQRIADPCFIGATIQKNCVVGSKVVRKNAPDEKVGVMCLEDGRPSIVEYYELTDELMNAKDEKGEPDVYKRQM